MSMPEKHQGNGIKGGSRRTPRFQTMRKFASPRVNRIVAVLSQGCAKRTKIHFRVLKSAKERRSLHLSVNS